MNSDQTEEIEPAAEGATAPDEAELIDGHRPGAGSSPDAPAIAGADASTPSSIDNAFAGEPDLMSEDDLKAVMIQFNPHSFKDIATIQKGVENFFLFQQSHLALTHPEQLQHLGEKDIQMLAERSALTPFEYVKLSEDKTRLEVKQVLIRPASLKGEQVAKVKLACVRGSVAAVLEYIHRRDDRITELEREGQLGQWVTQRFLRDQNLKGDSQSELNRMIPMLRNLSFDEYLAEEVKPREDLMMPMLSLLRRKADDLSGELHTYAQISGDAEQALQRRAARSVLLPLAGDFHVIQPAADNLIALPDESGVKEHRSELEYIYLLFVQMARKILFALLPREETTWIQPKGAGQDERYLEELKKHPSFLEGDSWQDARTFLECYTTLMKQVRKVREVRREYLVDLVTQQTILKLNMQFEPVLFSEATFEVPDRSVDSYIPRKELFKAVVERMKEHEDIATMEERRRLPDGRTAKGMYFMFRANLAQGFIRNPKRRNYMHLFSRSNGYENGIYDLLKDVQEGITPGEIIDEQIALSRAIRDWEAEQEKERLRKERAAMSLWSRFLAWLSALFGGEPKRRSEDAAENGGGEAPAQEKKRKSRKKKIIRGPREKQLVVPAQIQKVVDYVQRNFKGLIWLDEVMHTLNTVKFTEDQVGDFLFYDKYGRYTEVRPLINIRRVFLTTENEDDPQWIESTLDYLENIHQSKEEHRALIKYLRGLQED